MAIVLSRPRGLQLNPNTSGWARAFGGDDECPLCSHCGSDLTRRAAIHEGATYGVDCAVSLGLLTNRETIRPVVPYAMSRKDQALVAAYPEAWAFCEQWRLRGKVALPPEERPVLARAPWHTLWALACNLY